MPQIDEWIKQKLSEGFSKEQIKKALVEEGFDPTLVDLVTQDNKKSISQLKNRLIFLIVILSILVVSLIILLFVFENNPQNSDSLVDKNFENIETPNAFLDKGFFVSTDKINFNLVDNDLIYTNLSNETLDIVVLKISKFEQPLDKTVENIAENMNSSYSSIFLRKSDVTMHNNHKMLLQEYVIIERNYRKIIKNAFIDYNNNTLYITYKCNEKDLPRCDELFLESVEHVSLI